MQKLKASDRAGHAALRRRYLRLLTILAALLLFSLDYSAAQAVRVRRPRPRPDLFLFASLTVTASPTSVSFVLVHGGAATASAPVTVTTTYTFATSLAGQLYLYGYFLSPTSALTGGTPSSSIPSSNVFGQVPGGVPTSYTAFTQTTPYSGASGLELYYITNLPGASGSFSHTLNLKIDLTATPQLPAATYTGTLYLEAQSF